MKKGGFARRAPRFVLHGPRDEIVETASAVSRSPTSERNVYRPRRKSPEEAFTRPQGQFTYFDLIGLAYDPVSRLHPRTADRPGGRPRLRRGLASCLANSRKTARRVTVSVKAQSTYWFPLLELATVRRGESSRRCIDIFRALSGSPLYSITAKTVPRRKNYGLLL